MDLGVGDHSQGRRERGRGAARRGRRARGSERGEKDGRHRGERRREGEARYRREKGAPVGRKGEAKRAMYRVKAADRSALVQEAAAAREETSRPASVSGMLGAAIVILPPFHRAPIT